MIARIGFAAGAFAFGAMGLSALTPAGANPDQCSAVTNLCADAGVVEPSLTAEIELPARASALAEGDTLVDDFRVIREPARHGLETAPYGFFYAKVGDAVVLVDSDTHLVARRVI